MNRLKRTIVYLFALICILVAIGGAYDAHDRWAEYKDWKSVPCRIDKLKFDQGRDRFGTRLVLTLQFTYEFEGETYIGDRLDNEFNREVFSKFERDQILDEYSEGMSTSAYLNPTWPQQSFLRQTSLSEYMVVPVMVFFLGIWVIYLLRKTRPRTVPKRVYLDADDPDSRRWHEIYHQVINLDSIKIEGTAWYAQSPGLSQWPKSRVGLIATPNTIAVVRGPFRASGLAAAALTLLAEFFLAWYLSVIHFMFFAYEWYRRRKTWQVFRNATDVTEFTVGVHAVEIVSIDNTIMHGIDQKKNEFWYQLPSRPVDDHVAVRRSRLDDVDRFIGYVRLMQQSQKMQDQPAYQDEAPPDDVIFLQ